jgi:hypothetical protein
MTWFRRRPPAPEPRNYVRTWEGGLANMEYLESVDGVLWSDAPLPPKRHTCWAQTRGFMYMKFVHRCPCGGFSLDEDIWLDRNKRTPRVVSA